MIGIVVDFNGSKLKKYYDDYNDSMSAFEYEMKYYGASRVTNDFYIINCNEDCLYIIYQIVEKLKSLEWIKKSISKVKIFKIKDYSDFSSIVKEK